MMFVLKSLSTPIVWVLVLLMLGLVLAWPGGRKRLFKAGRFLLLLGFVLLMALSLRPVANFLTYPLESRYQPPSPETLDKLDVVVVLGGGMYPSGCLRREGDLGKYAYPRFCQGVRIFRQSDAKLLAFCGGPREKGTESEAEIMKAIATDLGIPEGRIVVETQSRTTFENVANLPRLLPAGPGRRIGLVTSALHMPRSHGVFVWQFPHDTIIPIPVFYTYDPTGWSERSLVPSASNLEQSTVALHEWIGLLWYRLHNR